MDSQLAAVHRLIGTVHTSTPAAKLQRKETSMSMGESNGNDWRERMDRVDRALDRLTERLDRLTERHEALAQSMELAQHDWEERWRKSEDRWEKSEDRWSDMQTMVKRVLGIVEQLAEVAKSHERRLDDLEGHRG